MDEANVAYRILRNKKAYISFSTLCCLGMVGVPGKLMRESGLAVSASESLRGSERRTLAGIPDDDDENGKGKRWREGTFPFGRSAP